MAGQSNRARGRSVSLTDAEIQACLTLQGSPETIQWIAKRRQHCGRPCDLAVQPGADQVATKPIDFRVSERLDVNPAQLCVTRRPNYACRSCLNGVIQAPAPARLIPNTLPTEATLAHVLVCKYADQLPLYRQAQIYRR